MSDTVPRKGLFPLAIQVTRDGPPMPGAAQAHAYQMALLSGCFTIHETLPSVQNGQVVDKVHVTRLGLDLDLGGLGNGLDGIQSLDLAIGQRREVARSGVGLISEKSGSTKIHDEFVFVEKDDGPALKSRPGNTLFSHAWERYPKGTPARLVNTYRANGQSERANVRMISGREATKTL